MSGLDSIVQSVLTTGEPVTVPLYPPVFGSLETIVDAARLAGLRIAGAPARCMTLLPAIPVDKETLLSLSHFYLSAGPEGRANARREIFMMLDAKTKEKTAAKDRSRSRGPLEQMHRTYHPADQVLRIIELVVSTAGLSGGEYSQLCQQVPLLHLAELQEVCDRLRSGEDLAQVGSAYEQLSLPAEPTGLLDPLQQQQLRQQTSSPPTSRRGRRRMLNVSSLVTQLEQIPSSSPKGLAGATLDHADADEPIPTGTEVVDEVSGSKPDPADGMTSEDPTPAVYLSEKDYEIISHDGIFYIDEDADEKQKYGIPLRVGAILLRKILPDSVCRKAARCLEPAATVNNLRAKTNGGVPPETGIVGFYDYLNNANVRKCRETQYTRQNWPAVADGCAPLLRALNAAYEKVAPAHFKLQDAVIPPHFRLFGTAFSTLTVNHNFRTAMHTDKGDFKNGLGVVAVIDGEFSGCHLAIPELRKAFKLGVGDVLLFDTSLRHGNTEVNAPEGMWTRTSIVAYLRTGLFSQRCEMELRARMKQALVPHVDKLLSSAGGDLQEATMTAVVNINAAVASETPIYIPSALIARLSVAQEAALCFASRRLERNTGCILAMSMGLGKTLVALCIAFSHLAANPADDIVILSPKTVIPHWVAEYNKWSELGGIQFDAFVTAGGSAAGFEEEILRYNQQACGETTKVGHVFVINPESLRSFMRKCPQLDPAVVIVDEGHKVSSKDSRFRGALQSLLRTNKRVVLSGTPIQNSVEDLFQLVEWISEDSLFVEAARGSLSQHGLLVEQFVAGDSSLFAQAKASLQFIMEWSKGYVLRIKDDALPPLNDFLLVCGSSAAQAGCFARHGLASCSVSLKASEHRPSHLACHPAALVLFLARIPAFSRLRSEKTLAAASSSANRRVAKATIGAKRPRVDPQAADSDEDILHRDEDASAAETFGPSDLAYLKWAEQLLSDERAAALEQTSASTTTTADAAEPPLLNVLRRIPIHCLAFLLDSGKLSAAVVICQHAAAQGEKVLIFSQYTLTQELIHRTLVACGVSSELLRGRDAVAVRTEKVNAFSHNNTTALVVSTRVGAFGIEVTAACHVILFDSWWNPQVDAQAIARAHRRNQKKAVTVYRLLSRTEDMPVVRAQQRKMALFRSVMDSQTTQAVSLLEFQLDCTEDDSDQQRRFNLWPSLKRLLLNSADSSGGASDSDKSVDGALPTRSPGDATAGSPCVISVHRYDSIFKDV
jgi:superfamily II DNA or RNA helicase